MVMNACVCMGSSLCTHLNWEWKCMSIDRVYWQLSLLIKSRASIKEQAVPLVTVGGRSQQEPLMQCGRHAEAGRQGRLALWEPLHGIDQNYIRENAYRFSGCTQICLCVRAYIYEITHQTYTVAVPTGSFRTWAPEANRTRQRANVTQWDSVGVFSGWCQAPLALWPVAWFDFHVTLFRWCRRTECELDFSH